MLAAYKIRMYCNFIGFYLVVEEMKGVIGQDAYDSDQVRKLEYSPPVVRGGYHHHTGLGG